MTAKPAHLVAYEEDFAKQKSSGIHIFTDEHRQKNRQAMQLVSDLLPFADINKTNDCDLIYRFLIARKWDVNEAVKSIRLYIQWRKDEHIDEVMWETVEDSVKEIVAVFFGLDREGMPVLWDMPNPKLIAKVLKVTPRPQIIRAHYKMMETARFLSRSNGVDRLTYVLDLTDVTMSSINSDSIGILKELSKCDQLYFPELGRRMLICNGGWAVNAAWKVLRPLLDERVQKKMQFLKHAPSISNVSEYISEDQVLGKYGGISVGLCGASNMTLVDQVDFAVSGPKLQFKVAPAASANSVGPVKNDGPLASHVAQHKKADTFDSTPKALQHFSSSTTSFSATTTNHFEDSQYFSLSDEDHDATAPRRRAQEASSAQLDWPTFSTSTSSRRGGSDRTRRSSHDTTQQQPHAAAAARARTSTRAAPPLGQPPTVHPGRSPKISFSPLVSSGSPQAETIRTMISPPTEAAPAAGRLGSGTAVELHIKRHGDIIRGFHLGRFIGETQFHIIVGHCDHPAHHHPASSTTVASTGKVPPPAPGVPTSSSSDVVPAPRVLLGQLLRETGHPFHTHLIVADSNRLAKFVLVKRSFHQQIVIYQTVGDQRIHTSKTSLQHTVLGDKAKMARCGERDSSNGGGGGSGDSHDWAVWGKMRVGNKEVRRYLAEKRGWTLLFYDTLAALPIQDLFALAVGLMELWEE